MRCSECGFKSDFAGFFRRERGGLFNIPKTVCEVCAAYNPTPFKRLVVLSAFTVPFGCLFLIPLTAADDPERAGFIAIMIATAVFTMPARFFIHEAGHAFAARLCGHVVGAAFVGQGPVRRRLRLGSVAFDILRYPWAGGRVVHVDVKGLTRRRELAFIAAAGPGANLFAAAIAFLLSWFFGDFSVLSAALGGFGFFNVFTALFNLIPRKASDKEALDSDGQLILKAFGAKAELVAPWTVDLYCVYAHQSQHRYPEALRIAVDVWQTSPNRLKLAGTILHNLSRLHGDKAAVDFYVANEDAMRPEGRSSDRHDAAWILANVAWSALKTRDPCLSDLAERAARAAAATGPDHPAIALTLGAWLVSAGQAAKGIRLLTVGSRLTMDRRDKADACSFLADGWRQQGVEARAEAFDRLQQYYETHL